MTCNERLASVVSRWISAYGIWPETFEILGDLELSRCLDAKQAVARRIEVWRARKDQRRRVNDDLRGGDVLRMALVLKLGHKVFLLQGCGATQEFEQRIFHIFGCILSAFVDGLKLCEVSDKGLGRDA